MSQIYRYSIDIETTKERVWEVMLNPKTFEDWCSTFYPGSRFEGSWEKGKEIRFITGEAGKESGMLNIVKENILYQAIELQPIAEINEGKIDASPETMKRWDGYQENYYLSENGDVTTVSIETGEGDLPKDMTDSFSEAWPKALARLKELAEDLTV